MKNVSKNGKFPRVREEQLIDHKSWSLDGWLFVTQSRQNSLTDLDTILHKD